MYSNLSFELVCQAVNLKRHSHLLEFNAVRKFFRAIDNIE